MYFWVIKKIQKYRWEKEVRKNEADKAKMKKDIENW